MVIAESPSWSSVKLLKTPRLSPLLSWISDPVALGSDIRKGAVPVWGKQNLSQGRFTSARHQSTESLTKGVFANPLFIFLFFFFSSEKPVYSSCHLWKGLFQVDYMLAIFSDILGLYETWSSHHFQERKRHFFSGWRVELKSVNDRGLPGPWKAGIWGRGEMGPDTLQAWNLGTGMSFWNGFPGSDISVQVPLAQI